MVTNKNLVFGLFWL